VAEFDSSAWVSERDGTVRHFSREGVALDPVIPGAGGSDAWLEVPEIAQCLLTMTGALALLAARRRRARA
jgi:hypothetical protein